MTEQELIHAALELDPDARIRVADQLIDSLNAPQAPDIDASWIEEVERRIDVYLTDPTQAKAGEDVMNRIRSRLRK